MRQQTVFCPAQLKVVPVHNFKIYRFSAIVEDILLVCIPHPRPRTKKFKRFDCKIEVIFRLGRPKVCVPFIFCPELPESL